MGKLVKISVVSAFFFGAACGVASAADGDLLTDPCPVGWLKLQQAMVSANTVPGGSGNPMWGVVMNRNGTVCAVAFSGANQKSQWLVSRQIAASKAWTANGLSIPGSLVATSQIYSLTQPGGPLYGVGFGSNPEDSADIYKGPFSSWGQGLLVQDPMVGRRVGGFISFGGGVALVKSNTTNPIGSLGVSGDSACRDDLYARQVRANLGLAPPAGSDGPIRPPACP
jgi:uncharacterized protein GlcG (DUF336 family)